MNRDFSHKEKKKRRNDDYVLYRIMESDMAKGKTKLTYSMTHKPYTGELINADAPTNAQDKP